MSTLTVGLTVLVLSLLLIVGVLAWKLIKAEIKAVIGDRVEAQVQAYKDAPAIQAALLRQDVIDTDFDDDVCMNCRFFEIEAAQAAMQRNPAFARVMAYMSPYENGKRVVTKSSPCQACMPGSEPGVGEPCVICVGNRVVYTAVAEYPANIPINAKWSEYGWCTNKEVLLEGGKPMTEHILYGGASYCDGRLFQLRLRKKIPGQPTYAD